MYLNIEINKSLSLKLIFRDSVSQILLRLLVGNSLNGRNLSQSWSTSTGKIAKFSNSKRLYSRRNNNNQVEPQQVLNVDPPNEAANASDNNAEAGGSSGEQPNPNVTNETA